jgi:hypothetical protein
MVQRFILWWKWHFGDEARHHIMEAKRQIETNAGRLTALEDHTAEKIMALELHVNSLQGQIIALGRKIDLVELADLQKQLDQLRANVAAHDEERKQVIRAKTWREFQTLTNEESLENVPAR